MDAIILFIDGIVLIDDDSLSVSVFVRADWDHSDEKRFPKFLLKIGSILLGEPLVVISMYFVSRISNICSIVIPNSMESWYPCGLHSKFLE